MMGWAVPTLQFLAPVCAGALFTLGLSPFDVWIAVPLSAALLLALLHARRHERGWLTGWLYGLGLFGSGASWVYVSIHVHGQAPVPLALIMTAFFCAGLALLFAVQVFCYVRWFLHRGCWATCLSFPALWVLFEWLRSWLLTGFPWLYAGYAATDTPLAGWAPIIGVYGISLWLVGLGSAIVALIKLPPRLSGQQRATKRKGVALYAGALAILGSAGALLAHVEWTPAAGDEVRVALYQPNIALSDKWNRRLFSQHLDQYQQATASLYGEFDIIVWPESALPAYRHQVEPFLDKIDELAKQQDTTLISGIPMRTSSGQHNSIIAIGAGTGEHHKQKLVPFGEYIPAENWLRGLITFFDLPMSNFTPGPAQTPRLMAGNLVIAPFICYEIVYPDFVSQHSQGSNMLLTVSNDSWFGASIGPLQHLQMARFRALENGLPLLRGTNNGVSAIIGHKGEVITQSPQFVEHTTVGAIQPRSGQTPFGRFGHWPALLLSVGLLVLPLLLPKR